MRLISILFGPKITLEQLSLFCGNLATCVAAGLDIPNSLRTCHRSSPSPVLKEILEPAAERTAQGMELSDALQPWKNRFPAFFLPVLRCGEQSGRMDQTLRYLERHCRLLARPARTMRNTWLVPLCLMLGGTAVCTVAYVVLAPLALTMRYLLDSLMFYGVVAVGLWAVFYVPQVKPIVDQLKLAIPVIGSAERELTLNRFFHAMNLLYSTGGRRVEEMIRLAAESAENLALRGDFLRAAQVIESGGTISEAFSALTLLPFDYKTTIVAGDEAGKLETAFDTVCRLSAESVQFRLAAFQALFFRVVAASVVFSTVMTLYGLMMMRG